MAASLDAIALGIPPDQLHRSRRPETLAAIILAAVLMVASVILRVTTRRMQRERWKVDDYSIVLALLTTLGCFVISCLMVHLGSGLHLPLVPLENHVPFYLHLYIYQFFYATSILLIKLSLLAFYVRIFSTSRRFILCAKLLFGVVLIWYVVAVGMAIFICTPISGFWKSHNPVQPPTEAPRCIDIKPFYIGKAIPNMLTDILILLLPLPSIWTLKMSRAQKVSVTGIFLLGAFTVLASILRLREQFRVDDKDFTWALNGTVVWSFLEPSCGVICACLPTIRVVFRGCQRSSFSSSSDSKKSSPKDYGHDRKLSLTPVICQDTPHSSPSTTTDDNDTLRADSFDIDAQEFKTRDLEKELPSLPPAYRNPSETQSIDLPPAYRKPSEAETIMFMMRQTVDARNWDEERMEGIPRTPGSIWERR